MKSYKKVCKFSVDFEMVTPLLIKSGFLGEFTDSSLEKTPDGNLHIDGYVWTSLIRRALLRLKDGDSLAKLIGKYDEKETTESGVSPLWCESSFVKLIETDVRPGNKINRQYATTTSKALYSDEIVPPGYGVTLNFNFFCDGSETSDIELLKKAICVIDEGIENIGGGWSYGFGRLRLVDNGNPVKVKELDLQNSDQRKELWKFDNIEWDNCQDVSYSEKDKLKGWKKFTIQAKIADGQLLAVHSNYPILDGHEKYPEIPDRFVYQRYQVEDNKPVARYVIPGKTIRQALLSTQIERKLRSVNESANEDVCLDSTEAKKECKCMRCLWFGNTHHSGIIAVSDAVVNRDAEPEILHRIQLCEHSMQNIQLFSGEYLITGEFSFDIWIDISRSESDAAELEKEATQLLKEMKKDSDAPPGWYRLGATSTCTGQIEIIRIGSI